MENQNQIQSRSTNIVLITLYWVYTLINFIFYIIIFNEISFSSKNKNEIYFFLIVNIIFFSLLFTSILFTVNFFKKTLTLLYICLIPSLINELTFIASLLIPIFYYRDKGTVILFLVILGIIFAFETIPNFVLFIYICKICKKSKNKSTQNIDNNNNNNSLILLNDIS